jgi:3-vinyl bacteriochlorophyllide hydratase
MPCWIPFIERMHQYAESRVKSGMLYTPEQRILRDQTIWTRIQGFLAIFQFLVFMVSLFLVLRCLLSAQGAEWAKWSIILKTLTLYTIMVTGSIWEKVVFGQYLFAEAFFWEDVVSMVVIALHTIYIASLFIPFLTLEEQMLLILSAYITYVINAIQFVMKLRAARKQEAMMASAELLNSSPSNAHLSDSEGLPA